MARFSRRMITLCVIVFVIFMVLYWQPPSRPLDLPSFSQTSAKSPANPPPRPPDIESEAALVQQLPSAPGYAGKVPVDSPWRNRQQHNPVVSFIPLPTNAAVKRPRIQHNFRSKESKEDHQIRLERLASIKEACKRTWDAYRQHAWTHDELQPISAAARDPFGGWAATIIDSLDTLWIMGLKTEFNQGLQVVSRLDFTRAEQERVNVFETCIRYLGGLLGAYDLSGERILLDKALELGEFLYSAFDTPNRMPDSRWDWKASLNGEKAEAGFSVVSAEIGSMSLEFTRLTQLSGEPKYYDAIARITKLFEEAQDKTNFPGLWPVFVNPRHGDVTHGQGFSLGAMADSLYEYLPKQWALLGGRAPEYQTMYERALTAAKQRLFFRPLNNWRPGEILLSGEANVEDSGKSMFFPKAQHLTCFVGGMVGLGAQLFEHAADRAVARQLTDGCIWAYNVTGTGIAPEVWNAVPCDRDGPDDCAWSETRWLAGMMPTSSGRSQLEWAQAARFPPGFTGIEDRIYQLRPEAIESVFYLYRISGDTELRERGWDMWQSVSRYTRTDIAYAGLSDVTDPNSAQRDRMESFWTAETLKYFYLLFADEDLISLDEFVFNTEAHPFRLPEQ